MAININGTSPPPVRGSGQAGRISSSTKLPGAGMPEQPVRASDALRLTPESLYLQKLEASLSSEPAVDKERVEALRNAVESGEYQVNSARTAKKMLAFESKLLK